MHMNQNNHVNALIQQRGWTSHTKAWADTIDTMVTWQSKTKLLQNLLMECIFLIDMGDIDVADSQ